MSIGGCPLWTDALFLHIVSCASVCASQSALVVSGLVQNLVSNFNSDLVYISLRVRAIAPPCKTIASSRVFRCALPDFLSGLIIDSDEFSTLDSARTFDAIERIQNRGQIPHKLSTNCVRAQ